ncbi:MAG: tRNA threonylcarbamoyladenosine dehydratase [Clostridia bacterium]|nr:tRNA threonylcarbamoyladenosine dehydratase [Clostridia bacterium]
MENYTDRLEILYGAEAVRKLKASKVAVVGVGGVGGYAAEAVARAFVGEILLIDADVVQPSNVNRQIIAFPSVVGQSKAELMKKRVEEINPECKVTAKSLFVTEENLASLEELWQADVIVDAIDSVPSKIALILEAKKRGVFSVSAMGAANREDITAFRAADISETHTCPLAKKIRKALAEKGVTDGVRVVFSTEKAKTFGGALGSNSFTPAAAGLLAASEAIKKIIR